MKQVFTFLREHPLMSIILLSTICFYYPSSVPKVKSDGKHLWVDGGIKYVAGKEIDLEIYPYMIQNRFLGMPSEAGVSQSIYYVTKKDLEMAKAQYEKHGGCWASIFSSYKREFMAVGDHKNISKFIKKEGPPVFYGGGPQFINIRAYKLRPTVDNTKRNHDVVEKTSQVAAMRNAELVSINSAWKLN